jgi:hypothetical protein
VEISKIFNKDKKSIECKENIDEQDQEDEEENKFELK